MAISLSAAALADSFGPPMAYFSTASSRLPADERDKLFRQVGGFIQHLKDGGTSVHCIVIKGYTDRVGATEYNQKLSLERAEAVRRAMDGHGLLTAPARTIGYGEARPLRETPDEVREPLNRRVEVYVYNYALGCKGYF